MPFCIIAWEVEVVIDVIKMSTGFRKPLPRRAEDIGVWEDVLNWMAAIACVANAYMVIHMAKFDYALRFSLSGERKANTFWIICVSTLILRWVTLKIVPGEPFHVKIQLARRRFLSDKLVMNRPDENFETVSKKEQNLSKKDFDNIVKAFFPSGAQKPSASLFLLSSKFSKKTRL